MHWRKILALCTALLLIVSCFLTWVTIPSKNILVTGVQAEGTSFGKPGLMHLFLASVYIILVLLNKIWSKRLAFFLAALNIGWALRNFLLISACHMGICPEKHAALYLVLIASIAMMITVLFVPSTGEINSNRAT
ncbi:MAG: hypothetical protein ICV51_00875 [Flavisolibacter sp.]|nr:hypothetical protein [Flavisolibacter sp.]MBD0374171.1 hypothetical protein [Flavisolibacter sp.]